MKLLITIYLSLISSTASASIIDLPATEKTSEVIYLLMNGTILGSMSTVLNLGCILFAGIIIGYTALSGVLNTAHEGNVMGKAYNSMWVPLRSVFAIALLMPMESGFSLVQYAAFHAGKSGAGLASHVWTASVDHIKNEGGLYPPHNEIQGEKIATALLRSSACLEVMNRMYYDPAVDYNPVTRQIESKQNHDKFVETIRYTGEGQSSSSWLLDFSPVDFSQVRTKLPVDICGTVILSLGRVEPDSISHDVKIKYVKSIQKALHELDVQMYNLARNLVNEQSAPPSELILHSAATEYNSKIKNALATATEELKKSRVEDKKWIAEAEKYGFIGAGSYYLGIMKMHQENFDFAEITPISTPPNLVEVTSLSDYKNNMKRVESYLENRITVDAHGEPVKVLQQKRLSPMDSLAKNLQASIRDSVTAHKDPTTALMNMGHSIINTIEIAGVMIFGAKAVADGAKNSVFSNIPGVGAAAGAVSSVASKASDLFMIVAGTFIVGAAFLAFYLPMIPFILWMMGVAGWIILLIEAIVAAPVWAAAHSIPEGGGFTGSHTRGGYMIILSLFMRPTLMLFGLFAGMIVSVIMAKLILFLLMETILQTSGDKTIGIVSITSYLIVLVVMMVILTQKTFSLIHVIPDKVLRYIGGQGETLGESEGESHGRTMAVGIVNRGERGLSRASGLKNKPSWNNNNTAGQLEGRHSPT